MSKIALIVEFAVKPGRRDEFIKHIGEHARGTLADEPGCVHFDVLLPKDAPSDAAERKENPSRVFLYEVYRDEEAFKAHGTNPRLAKTRKDYEDMIISRNITRCDVQ